MMNQNVINKLIATILEDMVQQRFDRKNLEKLKEMIEAQSMEEKEN